MNVTLDDIPVVENARRLGRPPKARSTIAYAYSSYATARNDPLVTLSTLSANLGLRTASFLRERGFPAISEEMIAGARAPSYSIYTDCGPYNYNASCNEACFGFAPHHMDPFYCATCAEQASDPNNNPAYFWHFVGSRGSIQYIDREPDVCAGKDAWKWKIEGACGQCSDSSVFRCHDGWKKYDAGSPWDPTICQGLIVCDDTWQQC